MYNWFLKSPLFDAEPAAGGGTDTIQVNPGVPYEHSQEPDKPEPKPVVESPEQKELKTLRAENERLAKRAQDAEEDGKYWATRARNGHVEERRPAEEESRPRRTETAAEQPAKLLDDMSTEGMKALEKRGFITADQLKEILAEQAKGIRGEITEARTDAEFGIKLSKEFPEIAEDSDRVSRGERPKTEIFKRAGELYREAVAEDPKLEGSKGLLLTVARMAKKELEFAAKGKKEAANEDETPVNGRAKDTDRQETRRRRIEAQRPDRSSGNEEEAGDPGFDPTQLQVMKHLGVKPEEFKKHAGGARNGR